MQRIAEVTSHAWADSTAGTYGSGLLLFHVFCDMRDVPEEQRAPASEIIVLSFVSALAGAYAPSAINNYVNGVRAWHLIHGLAWTVDKNLLEAAITGAAKLAPPAASRKKREPATVETLKKLAQHFDPSVHLDAAVWACILVAFFSLARLGELTVRNQQSFRASLHPSREALREESHRDGSTVRVIRLPRTKAAPQGEDISFAHQEAPLNPWAALDAHLALNDLPTNTHLFAYKRSESDRAGIPLTRRAFQMRFKAALQAAGVESLQGHSLRIGGTLEYLLRGVTFEAVKAIGRWKSDAFTLYLRKHAQVLAPYLQDNSDTFESVSRAVIQLPPVR